MICYLVHGTGHSRQLQKSYRYFFCVHAATDVAGAMFVLATILFAVSMALKASSKMCFGKMLSEKNCLGFLHRFFLSRLFFQL